jgi:hypothetical protein
MGGDVPHHAASGDGCGDDDFFHEVSSQIAKCSSFREPRPSLVFKEVRVLKTEVERL